ncbi:MAG: M14 family zinc carboxypeptidase, partial [Longimicrobiales bacterium]
MSNVGMTRRSAGAGLAGLALLLLTAASGRAQAPVPTPESVLGFAPGADFKLADYDDAIEYFRRLDAASDKLRLIEVGRTSRGRPWYLALISSPENLARIERYREIAQRLAHPAGLTDAEAHSLAREGRAFVDISGGLHASEVAGAQHTIQLAYDLVSAEGDPRTDAILEEVVLMLWPSLNPDGQEIVVDWYRENVGTPYEAAPLHELYQEYIGHDNNR